MQATRTETDLAPQRTIKSVRPRLIRSLIAVIVGSLILRVSAQMMGQMLQFYFATIDRNYFPISHTTSGLITASFFATELVGSLLLGALSDRYGRRVFIILGPLFGAVAVQITSMTVALWLLVLTRLLEGLSTASSVPATLGYLSDATSGRPALRARVVGIFEICFAGGWAVGSVLAGDLWEYFGKPATVIGINLISPAFSLNALIYLISFAIFVWGLKDIRRGRRRKSGSADNHAEIKRYVELLKSPRIWKFAPAWLAVNSIFGLWINHSGRLFTGKDQYHNQLLTGNSGFQEFGYGSAIFGAVFAVGVLAWSFIMGRREKTLFMLLGVAGLFVTLASVYTLNHLGSLSDPLFYPIMGLLLIGVLVASAFTPAALIYLADVTEAHVQSRGSIMGLYAVFLGIGQVVGTTVGGRFATWKGIDGLLILSAILGVITLVTLIELRKQKRA